MSDDQDTNLEPEQLELSLNDLATLRALVNAIAEGAYVASPDGRLLDANPALLEMMGAATLDDLRDHYAERLWVSRERRAELVQIVSERGSAHEFELEARRLDGSVISVLDTCLAQRGAGGEVLALYGVLLDITERKTWEEQLTELSMRDPLTGCYNQRYLDHQRRSLERPSYFWGCLVFDLEGLKAVNDEYGNEEGDRVLQRFAHFVIRHKRADDVLVRVGGDEFALFVEVVSPDNMEIIAQRMIDHGPQQAPLAFSIGHAYRKSAETLDEVVRRANEDRLATRGRDPSSDRRQA